MLRFFRSSGSGIFIVVLLLGALTWLHALSHPDVPVNDRYGTFMFRALSDLLKYIPASAVWSGFILFLVTAGMSVFVNNKLRLIDKISYLPGLCYILLIGGVPAIHRLSPEMIATGLIIFGFIRLVKSFESERLSYHYFTTAVFISAASFFYRYAYVYMAAVWFALMFLRPGYWREWVFSFLGFAFPVFLAFCWFFLVEDDYTRMGAFFGELFSVSRTAPYLSVSTIVFFAAAATTVVFAFGHLMRYLGSKKIIIRNGYYLLILIAIIGIAGAFIVPDTLPFAWYLTAFPLSFIPANYLATVRSTRWGTGVLVFLFASVAVAQIIYFSIFDF